MVRHGDLALGSRQSESLSRFLERRAEATPDATAFFWGDAAISYAALLDESRRAAQGLFDLGIRSGDRVALWLPNAPAWLALHFACARLGAIVVAVNTRFRSSEIADIVGRSGARILVLWPSFRQIDFMATLQAIDAAALDRLERIIVYGGYGGDATPSALHGKPVLAYERLIARPLYREDHGAGPVGSNIFTTSGTTKAPKFVLHDHYSVGTHAGHVMRRFGYDAPGSIVLQALPLCGVFGFAQAMASLAAGATMVMQATFDAEEAVALIRRHAITACNGSDDMFARLLAAGNGDVPFPTLRFCGFAAFNPALASLVSNAERHGLRLAGLYGASEVQALFALQSLEAPSEFRGAPGGFPVAEDYAVRIRDPKSGRLLAPGESGEIELKGPSAMAGYFGDPAATARTITEDGWVRSGDLGHLRGDGSFVFETRMGDVLRLGGYLVAPAEIEAHLQLDPVVAGCQVVGATANGGLQAVAFVILRPGAGFDEDALRQHCAAGLARFKVPARIVALDAFPTTPSANGVKIQRVKLREMAEAMLRDGP
jgi:fatty-acyl-CoA synthase